MREEDKVRVGVYCRRQVYAPAVRSNRLPDDRDLLIPPSY